MHIKPKAAPSKSTEKYFKQYAKLETKRTTFRKKTNKVFTMRPIFCRLELILKRVIKRQAAIECNNAIYSELCNQGRFASNVDTLNWILILEHKNLMKPHS